MQFDVLKNKLHDRKSVEADFEKQKKILAEKHKAYETASAVEAMFQEIVKEMQTELKGFLIDVNQQALDITFPGYEFNIEFSTKNDVPHAGIYIGNAGRSQKPMDSNGGGLANIIAMCSQMAAKKMSETRNVILADQPMADVSKGEKEQLAMQLLKMLTEDMKLQYIMISHIDKQIETADKTIRIGIKDDPVRGYPVSYIE